MLKKDLRILFMGTPEFAKASLEALCNNEFNVVGVFCKEDKEKGRGMKLTMPPVKEFAVSKNIPVYQPKTVKDEDSITKILEGLKPNLIIAVAYGKILPKFVLDYPMYGAINVHGSLLPKYRGAAPIQWSVINGDKETGVTTMYMDEGMDTGNMITKAKIDILPDDTYGTVHDKLMELGVKTLINDLERLLVQDGRLLSEKQPEEFTVAPMLNKEISKIDFNKNAEEICNLVRGTNPFPTAWCKLDDIRIYKVYKAQKVQIECNQEASNGQIIHLNDKKDLFIVKCNDGAINLAQIKPAGSRLMGSGEYIRGGKVHIDEKFI